MRLSDPLLGQDVRLQEAGEEADQEAAGRDHGHHREADPPEGQLALRRQPGLRLRDEGGTLPRYQYYFDSDPDPGSEKIRHGSGSSPILYTDPDPGKNDPDPDKKGFSSRKIFKI